MLDLLGIPALLDQVVAFFTLSPFWEYLFWGVLICLGAMLLGWLFPPLRSLAGAVVLSVAAALFAYRRGEKDAEKREREKQARAARRAQRQERDPWGWWK